MSAQVQIVKFLEYMKIPIAGHVHEGCNLGNCAYLQIDFSTPEGLNALGNALEMFIRSQKEEGKRLAEESKFFARRLFEVVEEKEVTNDSFSD